MDDTSIRIAQRASAEIDGGVSDDPPINITREMVEAGKSAAVEFPAYVDTYSEERIYRIFLAMERVRRATKVV